MSRKKEFIDADSIPMVNELDISGDDCDDDLIPTKEICQFPFGFDLPQHHSNSNRSIIDNSIISNISKNRDGEIDQSFPINSDIYRTKNNSMEINSNTSSFPSNQTNIPDHASKGIGSIPFAPLLSSEMGSDDEFDAKSEVIDFTNIDDLINNKTDNLGKERLSYRSDLFILPRSGSSKSDLHGSSYRNSTIANNSSISGGSNGQAMTMRAPFSSTRLIESRTNSNGIDEIKGVGATRWRSEEQSHPDANDVINSADHIPMETNVSYGNRNNTITSKMGNLGDYNKSSSKVASNIKTNNPTTLFDTYEEFPVDIVLALEKSSSMYDSGTPESLGNSGARGNVGGLGEDDHRADITGISRDNSTTQNLGLHMLGANFNVNNSISSSNNYHINGGGINGIGGIVISTSNISNNLNTIFGDSNNINGLNGIDNFHALQGFSVNHQFFHHMITSSNNMDSENTKDDTNANNNTSTNANSVEILVVDDSLLQRKISQSKLQGVVGNNHWIVNCVENGESALQHCESSIRLPDVIIIDQNMSSTGGRLLGHEVVAFIRKKREFERIVIIGCTGFAEEATRYFYDAGCDAVWNKPMPSKNEAMSQILKILDYRRHVEAQQQRTMKLYSQISNRYYYYPNDRDNDYDDDNNNNQNQISRKNMRSRRKALLANHDSNDGNGNRRSASNFGNAETNDGNVATTRKHKKSARASPRSGQSKSKPTNSNNSNNGNTNGSEMLSLSSDKSPSHKRRLIVTDQETLDNKKIIGNGNVVGSENSNRSNLRVNNGCMVAGDVDGNNCNSHSNNISNNIDLDDDDLRSMSSITISEFDNDDSDSSDDDDDEYYDDDDYESMEDLSYISDTDLSTDESREQQLQLELQMQQQILQIQQQQQSLLLLLPQQQIREIQQQILRQQGLMAASSVPFPGDVNNNHQPTNVHFQHTDNNLAIRDPVTET